MLDRIRKRLKRTPDNTISANLKIWSEHDWSITDNGWPGDSDWKASLIRHVFEPNVPIGSRVLEIGPGAGRWTEHIVDRAFHVVIVDLTPKCIEICRERFQSCANIDYHVNDGKDLSFVNDRSIDRIWSWDVFVHISSSDVKDYVRQFERILSPGGRGVIHHSKSGKSKRGWRSDMTAEKMAAYCDEFNMRVVNQFCSWDNDRFYVCPDPDDRHLDVITIFERPAGDRDSGKRMLDS